ncbi:MAG: hypothetical protein U5P41_15490 [Gammaproteobacteria bacterium]|nr:hypothetical protein [Gammaproteobacteria bacterium]
MPTCAGSGALYFYLTRNPVAAWSSSLVVASRDVLKHDPRIAKNRKDYSTPLVVPWFSRGFEELLSESEEKRKIYPKIFKAMTEMPAMSAHPGDRLSIGPPMR